MMNAEMFKQWVEGRLMPTFEALYGPGTKLGGEKGKKMIVIMVCAHNASDFLSENLNQSLIICSRDRTTHRTTTNARSRRSLP